MLLCVGKSLNRAYPKLESNVFEATNPVGALRARTLSCSSLAHRTPAQRMCSINISGTKLAEKEFMFKP